MTVPHARVCMQVAVNKPSGLQVLPAAMFHMRTVLTLLGQHFNPTLVQPCTVKEQQDLQQQRGDQQQWRHGDTTCDGGGLACHVGQTALFNALASSHAPAAEPSQAEIKEQQLPAAPGAGSRAASATAAVKAVPVHRLGRGTSGEHKQVQHDQVLIKDQSTIPIMGVA